MCRKLTIVLLVIFLCNGSYARGDTDSRYNFETNVKRLALVVGNADYTNAEPLPGSLEDAKQIADRLRSQGFVVTLVQNAATRDDFLTKFLTFLDQIEEGSFVVFYFSGHGFTYGGESYLAPLEFPKKVPSNQVFTTFISASALQERINLKSPGLFMMFLDACRNVSGFIDNSAGGASDVEKGLASLARVQNNIIGYASEPGRISVGSSSAGELSKYTKALVAHLPSQDIEFDRLYKNVIIDVRQDSAANQSPWLNASSTLEVYFNPSPTILGQFKAAWQAAQQSDTPDAVRRYLSLYGLGPYAASARKWLAERSKMARTFTQFSAPQIDSLWKPAADASVSIFGTRITGPFGLPRVTGGNQSAITKSSSGIAYDAPVARLEKKRDPLAVAAALAGSAETIVLESVIARVRPDADAKIIKTIESGTKLSVSSFEVDQKGDVWIAAAGAANASGPDVSYIQVPATAGTLDVILGKALKEFDLTPAQIGSAGIADQKTIDEALASVRSQGKQITWVSISVPKESSAKRPFGERGDLILSARASHGAFLMSQSIPRGRITIVEGANFQADYPRVRIFGK